MTPTQIEVAFNEAIQEKAIYNKLEGISRNTVFNWLNDRSKPTIGDMLNVLYQLKKVEIIPSSSWNKVGDDLRKLAHILENNGTNAIIGSHTESEIVEDITGTKRLILHSSIRPNSNKL